MKQSKPAGGSDFCILDTAAHWDPEVWLSFTPSEAILHAKFGARTPHWRLWAALLLLQTARIGPWQASRAARGTGLCNFGLLGVQHLALGVCVCSAPVSKIAWTFTAEVMKGTSQATNDSGNAFAHRVRAPRATELPCGRFGVPLPYPHAPLYLQKDDLRACTACTGFREGRQRDRPPAPATTDRHQSACP